MKTKLIILSTFLLLVILSLGLSSCCKDTKYSLPEIEDNLISESKVDELNKNYSSRAAAIKDTIGKADARSSWYSLVQLKEYIKYIEQQGKKEGYQVDGIRFYIGAYSEKEEDPGRRNYTTIYLTPTGARVGEGKVSQGSFFSPPPDEETGANVSSDISSESLKSLNYGSMGKPPETTVH